MNKVREIRQKRGLVQQALAVRAKVSPSTLIMIERYGYCPGVDMKRRIAEALGVSEDGLFPSKVKERGNDAK